MRYPDQLRSLLGLLPMPVRIDGAGREVVLRAFDPVFHRAQDGQHVALRVQDTTLDLDLDHANERLLQYAFHNVLATYDRTDLGKLIRRLIRGPEDVFMDIGANIGVYSLLARRCGGRALLFEPEPLHAALLQRNQAAFGKVYACALADFSGSAEFHIGKSSKPGTSSLVGGNPGSEAYVASVQVPVRTLDEIAATDAIDAGQVKLIKVDVEGSEAQTIRGMQGFLSRAPDAAIWCEVRGPTSGRAKDSYREVTDLLARSGHVPYVVKRGKARPFDPARERLRRVFDLLFCRPGHAALR